MAQGRVDLLKTVLRTSPNVIFFEEVRGCVKVLLTVSGVPMGPITGV